MSEAETQHIKDQKQHMSEFPFGTLSEKLSVFNLLTLNVNYSGRTAPLTSKFALYIFIQQIICTEYFKHIVYSPFFSLQNAVCFIILKCLVPVLFTYYKQGVLKLKKSNSGAKRLIHQNRIRKEKNSEAKTPKRLSKETQN